MALYKQALILALAALMVFDRCHAASIPTDAADQDPSAVNRASDSSSAAAVVPASSSDAAAKGKKDSKEPTCPPLDLLLLNPIDVGFSRDCILSYLARAFSKDMVPINKKAITYAVDHLERALTQLQMLNGQMRACDDTVQIMIARDVQAKGGPPVPPPNGLLPPPPPPNGLPPPDSNGNVPPPPPRQSNLPNQPSASVVGQAVVLPPGSAIVVPTAAVSAAAAKQAVASNAAAGNKNA